MESSSNASGKLNGDTVSGWIEEHMRNVFQLRAVYSSDGSPSTLDEAITMARAVHEDATSTAPETVLPQIRVASLRILAELLELRSYNGKDIAYMEDSIQCLNEAVQLLTDEPDKERIQCFKSLTIGLMKLYRMDKTTTRLAKIADIVQALVDHRARGSLDKVLALKILGQVCESGYEAGLAVDYLDRAIGTQVTILEEPELKPLFLIEALGELISLLHKKFRVTQDTKHLDSAVSVTENVLRQFSDARSDIRDERRDSRLLHILTLSLLRRYQVCHATEDLQNTVNAFSEIASGPLVHDKSTSLGLLVTLDSIFESVYNITASYALLVGDVMLPVVRYLDSLPSFPYGQLLCRRQPTKDRSIEARVKEPAIAWLSSMANQFEAAFQLSQSAKDLEVAIRLSFQALQLCEPETAIFGSHEAARRHRWRLWSDHVGKIPGTEISVIAFDHGTWIPPELAEMQPDLSLQTDAFLFGGALVDSSATAFD